VNGPNLEAEQLLQHVIAAPLDTKPSRKESVHSAAAKKAPHARTKQPAINPEVAAEETKEKRPGEAIASNGAKAGEGKQKSSRTEAQQDKAGKKRGRPPSASKEKAAAKANNKRGAQQNREEETN